MSHRELHFVERETETKFGFFEAPMHSAFYHHLILKDMTGQSIWHAAEYLLVLGNKLMILQHEVGQTPSA